MFQKKKKWLAPILSGALALSIALTACGGGDKGNTGDNGSNSGGSDGEVVSGGAGGTIVFGLSKTWETMRTADFINGSTHQVGSQIFDKLVYLDEDNAVHPRGASSWDWAEDGMSVTFHLNENAKWHDGEPVTAEDYVFSYQFYSTSEVQFQNRAGTKYLVGVDPSTGIETAPDAAGAEAVDTYTLKLNMNSVYNQTSFLSAALNSMYVLPKHCFTDEGGALMSDEEIYSSTFWNAPIGSGPCRYVSEVADSSVTLEAVKDYHLGAPQFDTLIMQVIDTSTAVDKILSGDVDILGFNLATEVAEQFLDDEDITILKEKNPSTQVNLCFNCKRVPQKIRQAIDKAIDKTDILNKIYGGNGVINNSVIFPTYPGYKDLGGYDPDGAKELVQQAIAAGEWAADDVLVIGVVNTVGENAATLIKSQLANIGIQAEIRQDEMATIQQSMITDTGESPEYQYSCAIWSVGATYIPTKMLGVYALYSDYLFFHNDPAGVYPIYTAYLTAKTPDDELPVIESFLDWEAENVPQSTIVQYGAYSATAPNIGNADVFNPSNFNHASWLWTVS